jgi:hypothetical protein
MAQRGTPIRPERPAINGKTTTRELERSEPEGNVEWRLDQGAYASRSPVVWEY